MCIKAHLSNYGTIANVIKCKCDSAIILDQVL